MNFILKLYHDQKYLAWSTWSLLSNNPVKKTLYLLFCLIDLLIIMAYSFVLVERVHFTNFKFSESYMQSNLTQSQNNLTVIEKN